MTVLAHVVDPDGRRVELTVERWEHIVDDHVGHPELAAYRGDVMLAVSEPHEHRPGRRDTTSSGTSVGTSAPAAGCR
jgi:hypothetical protein